MTIAGNTVEVVSPQFPCGAAWLANCLLELQVPMRDLWGYATRDEWTVDVSGVHRYTAQHLPWQQTLASLEIGREFRFRDDVAARFSHDWPWQFVLSKRIVLVVRDPRDALYSEWQRHRRNLHLPESVSFPVFLEQPFFGGPISIADALWLYLRSWIVFRDTLPERVHVLRFEDWKRDPVGALRSVCAWIGIRVSDNALASATAASGVQRLLDTEAALAERNPGLMRFNRRGEPGEWRTAWKPEWFAALGSHWQPVLAALDYAPLTPQAKVPRSFDLQAVLDWRGLTDPVRKRLWSELLESGLIR